MPDALRRSLTDEQWRVTQEKGTERPFTGRYLHNAERGMYACVCCGQELFASDTKFDSGRAGRRSGCRSRATGS